MRRRNHGGRKVHLVLSQLILAVFVQELAAAFMAASKLARHGSGESLFKVNPSDLTKEVPGGMFSMLYAKEVAIVDPP